MTCAFQFIFVTQVSIIYTFKNKCSVLALVVLVRAFNIHWIFENLLWNGKIPLMLKILHGTIDANKTLNFEEFVYF